MEQIRVLDSQVANLIAAGEVVDRPAGVAKELCENALDAGASAITVEIKNGGVSFLRVADNGCGMSRTDAENCVLRHATSKISKAEDLDAIQTLGFRGEALAAISAVSRFSILTKRESDAFGSKLEFSEGKLISCEDAGCPDGTTVLVEDLFYNQPARRKFLKRDQTEQGAVLQYVQRLAVAFPKVSFTFLTETGRKFSTPGDGQTLSAIRAVFGKEISDSLFEVDYTLENLRVTGFVSRPEAAKNTRSHQCFYINSRFVKSKTMFAAMTDAFRSYLKSDRHPICFLYLKTAFADVDVNVHPAKLEVRFSDERLVYRAVYGAVRSALTLLTNPFAAQTQSFEPERIPRLPESEQIRFAALPTREPGAPIREEKPQKTLNVASPSFSAQTQRTYPRFSAPGSEEKMQQYRAILFAQNEPAQSEMKAPQASGAAGEIEEDNPLKEDGVYLGAVFQAFLLYETASALYIIDKHAAHERILYESLIKKEDRVGEQMLLVPAIVKLDPMESSAVTEALDEINAAGFLLDAFGENTFALRGVPAEYSGLGEGALQEAISSLANELLRGGKASAHREAVWDRALYTAACKAAMKAGLSDSREDCLWVIEKLKELKNVFVCPHGRPIVTVFNRRDFEKLFFRA